MTTPNTDQDHAALEDLNRLLLQEVDLGYITEDMTVGEALDQFTEELYPDD